MRRREMLVAVTHTHTHTHVYNLKENKKGVKAFFVMNKNER